MFLVENARTTSVIFAPYLVHVAVLVYKAHERAQSARSSARESAYCDDVEEYGGQASGFTIHASDLGGQLCRNRSLSSGASLIFEVSVLVRRQHCPKPTSLIPAL